MSGPFARRSEIKPDTITRTPTAASTTLPVHSLTFGKGSRLLRPAEFRRVYQEGVRFSSPYFAAFCLERGSKDGARVGFTLPRAIGGAVVRNRIRRRIREYLRREWRRLAPQWDIVLNPRRAALDASVADLYREVERLILRCSG